MPAPGKNAVQRDAIRLAVSIHGAYEVIWLDPG